LMMEKKRANSGPFITSICKHSIYKGFTRIAAKLILSLLGYG
jgi:hypothetical protein